MSPKKTETKIEKLEREYVIPLRDEVRKVPRYKKANKAIRTIKEFLVKHMKIYDRDLRKIKIDKYLNEFVWFRGIRNPPHKVKVKAIKEDDIVKVELAELPNKLKFKKLREERVEKTSEEIGKRKKKEKEEVESKESKTDEEKKSDDEKKEESEKKSSVVEAGKQMEKQQAKIMKHQTGGKTKQPKRPQRFALEK